MRQKQEIKPGITIGLIAANVFVFLILQLWGKVGTYDYMNFMRRGGVYPSDVQEGQYWRLLTSTFMHFDFEHIMNNMLILACAGVILEKALGHIRYLVLYLLAGVGGSTLSCMQMIYRKEEALAAGASGAIFGIIGALLWIVIRHKGRYETLTGGGLVFMIVLSIYSGVKNGGVDNWGHIGGLLMGFLLAIILYRKERKAVDFDSENLYTRE